MITFAKQHNVSYKVEKRVLRIKEEVPTKEVKDEMWKIYNQLDPNFKSEEVVLNVEVNTHEGDKVKVISQSDNLNIRQLPGAEQRLVGKAAQGEILTLLRKESSQWSYIRINEGVEGYCYASY